MGRKKRNGYYIRSILGSSASAGAQSKSWTPHPHLLKNILLGGGRIAKGTARGESGETHGGGERIWKVNSFRTETRTGGTLPPQLLIPSFLPFSLSW